MRRASHGSALPGDAQGKNPRATNGSTTGRHLILSLDRPPDGCDRGFGRVSTRVSTSVSKGEEKGPLAAGQRPTNKSLCDMGGMAGCMSPPCMGRAPTASHSAVVPPACCKSTRRSLGRRMAGRTALFRGHPTDMAPQPSNPHHWHWRRGQGFAASSLHPLQRLSSAHTYQPSPPSTALPHPPLPLLQLLPISPSTIATASSLLQLPERHFCARIDAV